MNKKNLFKILAFIVGPLIPMIIGAYFLFPYLNAGKYQKVVKQYKKEHGTEESDEVSEIGEDFATLKERARVFQKSIGQLKNKIDSLGTVNDSLKKSLLTKEKEITKLKNGQDTLNASDSTLAKSAQDTMITDKNFSKNVKSLLGLDVEELAPIISQMDDQKLVRIYEEANSIQRKKLLRSLKANRAAKLMMEVL